MRLISAAQNQEDIMLWRALREVRGGFYIDVGAADPFDLSVTKIFYDHGWHGVNLEPSPTYFDALNTARPRDINLRVGVGREAGSLTFFHVVGTGLSTFNRQIAMVHRSGRWEVVEEIVETLTLAEVCRRHRPHGPIHFLKIDVEGTEGEVLASADFVTFRPWIVLAEATLPLSEEESYPEWEPILTGQGYSFVWFDGLNCFYVSEEMKAELEKYFRVQPNVFDGFATVPELFHDVQETEQARTEANQAVQAAAESVRQMTATLAEQARLAAESHQRALRVEEEAAETIRRTAEAMQRTAATLAQQSALTAEAQRQNSELILYRDALAHQLADAQRQNSELIPHRDALAHQLADAQAQYAALKVSHEHVRAALSEAERRREESLASLGGAREAARRAEDLLEQIRYSTSWRVTAPLRVVRRLLPGAADSLVRQGKELARRAFHHTRDSRAPAISPAEARLHTPAGCCSGREATERAECREQSVTERRAHPSGQTSDLSMHLPADVILEPAPDLSQEETFLYRQFTTSRFANAKTG